MILDQIHHQLIVSCQALEEEPLHSSFIMGRLALAAEEGGAKAIRANSVQDIQEIQRQVDLPIIGIIKRDYPDSSVYITATKHEVNDLISETRADIIALDATDRTRPHREKLQDLLLEIHNHKRLAMADISNYAEGLSASEMGFDLISTTLSGYTEYTEERDTPDFMLIKKLACDVSTPIIMEGHTTKTEDVIHAFQVGAYAAVVGGAITRPQQITHRYSQAVAKYNQKEIH